MYTKVMKILKKIKYCVKNEPIDDPILKSGYDKMIEANDIYKIRCLIKDICIYENSKMAKTEKKLIIPNLSFRDVALFSSQSLTSILFTQSRFFNTLAYYYGTNSRLVFPLKRDWFDFFKSRGIILNRPLCRISWFLFMMIFSIREVLRYFNSFFSINKLFVNKEKNITNTSNFVYFYDISESNIPSMSQGITGKNFVNWYKNNIFKEESINVVHNIISLKKSNILSGNVATTYKRNLFFDLSLFSEIKIIFWIPKYLVKNFMTKSLSKSIIFSTINEIIMAKRIFEYSKQTTLHSLVFNSSIGAKKPLWAVALENCGTRIDYCFYACYGEPKDSEGNFPVDGFWSLANWKRYFVTDGYHKEQLTKELVNKDVFFSFNNIPWWGDTDINLPKASVKSIALFDTLISDSSYTLSTMNQLGWGKFDVALKYSEIIFEIAAKLDLQIFYKLKRFSSIYKKENYQINEINRLIKKYKANVMFIDPKIAPLRIIEATMLTISKPVSTTALIAREFNKPSIYIDPTSKIKQSDPAIRGIQILNNGLQLEEFLINQIKLVKAV